MPRFHWLRNLWNDDDTNDENTTFKVHAYRYRCAKWYGWVEGARSVVLEDNTDVAKALHRDAMTTTQSSDCSVTLVQVYNMAIQNIKPFAALGIGVQPLARVPESEGSESAPKK